MSLASVRTFLKTKQIVSWQVLKAAFAEDEDMLQAMLQYFISRGQLHSKAATPKCGDKCNSCDLSQLLVYHWRA